MIKKFLISDNYEQATKHQNYLTFLHKNLLLLGVLGGQFLPKDKQRSFTNKIFFHLQTQHVHSSSMVELPNGDLLSCWFQGTGERKADDVKIMGSRLKEPKKWEEPFIMSDTPGFPDCNPVLFLNQKNELFLFWLVIKGNRWEESLLKYKKA